MTFQKKIFIQEFQELKKGNDSLLIKNLTVNIIITEGKKTEYVYKNLYQNQYRIINSKHSKRF